MDAFAQPIETLVLTDEVLQAPAQLNSATDWIFDARACVIDAAFVSAYQNFLAALTSDQHSGFWWLQQNSGSFQKTVSQYPHWAKPKT